MEEMQTPVVPSSKKKGFLSKLKSLNLPGIKKRYILAMYIGIGAGFLLSLGYFVLSLKVDSVYVTNITSSSATISWKSPVKSIGSVIVSEDGYSSSFKFTSTGEQTGYDDRDYSAAEMKAAAYNDDLDDKANQGYVSYDDIQSEIKVTSQGWYYMHHVTIKNLSPETKYEFMVGNGSAYVKSENVLTEDSSFTTFAQQDSVAPPEPVYGVVMKSSGTTDTSFDNDSVVYTYAEIPDVGRTTLHSSVTAENGSWYVDYSNPMSPLGESYGSVTQKTKVFVWAHGRNDLQRTIFQRRIENSSPMDPILLTGEDSTLQSTVSKFVMTTFAQEDHGCSSGSTECRSGDKYKCVNNTSSTTVWQYQGSCEAEPAPAPEPTPNPTPDPVDTGGGGSSSGSTSWSVTCDNGHSYYEDDPGVLAAFGSESKWKAEACASGADDTSPDDPPTTTPAGSTTGAWLGYCGPCVSNGADVGAAACGGLRSDCSTYDGLGGFCDTGGSGFGSMACPGTSDSGSDGTEPSPPATVSDVCCLFSDGSHGRIQSGVCKGNMGGVVEDSVCLDGETIDEDLGNGPCQGELGRDSNGEFTVVTFECADVFWECGFKGIQGAPADAVAVGFTETLPNGSTRTCGSDHKWNVTSSGIGTQPSAGIADCKTADLPGNISEYDCDFITYDNYSDSGYWTWVLKDSPPASDLSCVTTKSVALTDYWPTSLPSDCENKTASCTARKQDDGKLNETWSFRCNDPIAVPLTEIEVEPVVEPAPPEDPGVSMCRPGSPAPFDSWSNCQAECQKSGENCTTKRSNDFSDDACSFYTCTKTVEEIPEPPKPDVIPNHSTADLGTYDTLSKCETACVDVPDFWKGSCSEGAYDTVGMQRFYDMGEDEAPAQCSRSDTYCTYEEGIWYVGSRNYRCSYSRAETVSWIASLVNRLGLINRVHAQEDSSDVIYFDASNGVYYPTVAGQYQLEFEGRTYAFEVDGIGSPLLLYVDVNDNGSYDEGVDTVITDDLQELSLNRTSTVLTYEIKKGLNFVSFPIIPDEINMASDLLSDLNEKYEQRFESISKFDGTWRVVADNGSNVNVNDFQIVPGIGYLLKSEGNVTIRVEGKEIVYNSSEGNAPISLSPGWNLIGLYGTGAANYTAESLLDGINDYADVDFSTDNISRWPTEKARYEGMQKEVDENGVTQVYGFDFPLNQKTSYFVRVLQGQGDWQPEFD